jgi:hypothetical protein
MVKNSSTAPPARAVTRPALGTLELFCFGRLADGEYGYAFTDFDQVDTIIRHSKRVGFAIPMHRAACHAPTDRQWRLLPI